MRCALRANPGFQEKGWLQRLVEIEAVRHIVCCRVAVCECLEPEACLQKSEERGEFILCVANEALLSVRRNDEQRHTGTEAKLVNSRRRHVVIETAEIVQVMKMAV